MKVSRLLLLLLSVSVSATFGATATNCGCACCKGKEICCCNSAATPDAKAAAPKRHPLKGVVVAVDAERSELTVKHEEIPGVMRAMTMVFKVERATAAKAKKGDAITAQMSRQDDTWRLHDVKTGSAPR